MHILIAPNAYKNAASASSVAKAISDGLKSSRLDCTCESFPIGDGGDGTGELLIERFQGSTLYARARGPLGESIEAPFGLVHTNQIAGLTAIIEMAAASGIHLLEPDELDPLRASTVGTGDLILAALDNDVHRIILAIGGSATVDGGIGILYALGARFLDDQGQSLPPEPRRLKDLERIDLSGLDKRLPQVKIVVLCDVGNILLGPSGAAAVFGPQKGANQDTVVQLEANLTHWRDITLSATGKDMASIRHGGAAGGVAACLYAFFDAELVNGADYFLELTGFDARLADADILITAEGSIDSQTLQGKGPAAVAEKARARNIPVIGLAGSIPLTPDPSFRQYFDVLLPIGNAPLPLPEAMRGTAANLTRTAAAVGDLLELRVR